VRSGQLSGSCIHHALAFARSILLVAVAMIITSERILLVFGASPPQLLFATLSRATQGAVPLASLTRAANPKFRPAPTASAHLPRAGVQKTGRGSAS